MTARRGYEAVYVSGDSPSADDAELAREWLAVQSGRGWRAASGDVVALDSSVEATHSD